MHRHNLPAEHNLPEDFASSPYFRTVLPVESQRELRKVTQCLILFTAPPTLMFEELWVVGSWDALHGCSLASFMPPSCWKAEMWWHWIGGSGQSWVVRALTWHGGNIKCSHVPKSLMCSLPQGLCTCYLFCFKGSLCSRHPLIVRRACVLVLSHIRLFATLWTVACQALLSMGFSRQ